MARDQNSRIPSSGREFTHASVELRGLRPIWLPANLGCAPIWQPTKLSLVLILPIGKIENIKRGCLKRMRDRRPDHGENMKRNIVVFTALILLAASIPAHAKKNPPRAFQLRDVVTLNGAQVPAGIYQLTWETHGSTARVTLSKDGKFVATAEGISVRSGVKYLEDEALLRVNSDGTRSLIEIRMAGASRAIVFNHSDITVHYTAMKP
jgi:hypothetical protein